MKYRKKPVIIEAIQIGTNLEEIRNFVGDKDEVYVGKGTHIIYVNIHTLEGTMTASKGDFIIRGVEGELYPCKEDIFYKTYELIGETDQQSRIIPNKWIPVSERLPENHNQEVLISLKWGIDIGWYSDGEWHSEWINHYDDGNVLAWMPLPEPYQGETE